MGQMLAEGKEEADGEGGGVTSRFSLSLLDIYDEKVGHSRKILPYRRTSLDATLVKELTTSFLKGLSSPRLYVFVPRRVQIRRGGGRQMERGGR